MSGSLFDTPRAFGSGAIEPAKFMGSPCDRGCDHRLLERLWSELTAKAALVCNLLWRGRWTQLPLAVAVRCRPRL
jgi:hypothetical protein